MSTKRRSSFRPPGDCPQCGEDVPRGAKACPYCGSDENTGWLDEADDYAEAGDAPFNYDDFRDNEFGDGKDGGVPKKQQLHPMWVITAVVLIAIFFYVLWLSYGAWRIY
ncbi:hypothetical protein DB346_08765 [Verrucomicrobia bacterium LW23]|nr:hypothetical protein DB346_08765 [Verrucomicrobia bacterium LW23]